MNFSIKYRPKNLSEVVGHEKIIKELSKRSKSREFPNVFLFTGKPGTGKTTLERIMAKNILCNDLDLEGNCCTKCDICESVQIGNPTNYYYEFNASNLGIDDMRTIELLAQIKSLSQSKSKVIVIDELQELSNNKKAQKNILKVLEMPLKNTYFILGCMNESKIDKAILRRAVKYKLQDLDEKEIGQCLISICEKNNIDLTDENKIQTLVTIVQNSENSIGIAIPYLERVIYSEIWNADEVLKELGIISQDKISSIINQLLKGEIDVLSNDINSDILDDINYNLLLYYKAISGYKVAVWQQGKISSIGKFSISKVQYAITRLSELLKYNYVNSFVIDFALIDIVNYCQEIIPEQPKRRRQNV